MTLQMHGPRGQRDIKPEKFGPQADLCRRTECAMCWWLHRVKDQPRRFTLEGIPAYAASTDPKPMGGWKTRAHHEPPRSLGGTDEDTVPLCDKHHTRRHATTPQVFWGFCDWTKVRDEMRRRAA